MSQSLQETQCSLYEARENSKRGLPMVWEMAYSHSAHKADSAAWPAMVLTKSVAYFLIPKKGEGGRKGAKKKAPHLCCLALAEETCLSLALFIKDCILVWRTEEGVLMIDMELLLLPCCTLLLPDGGVTGGGIEVVRTERHLVRKGYRT